ncbi:uncharacterized protein CcaverHIS019_0601000 [Cutaneotrichosporon cavernicola]|uniref:HCP-like protein n=1 Tax=Cutaneotrichosporon cavernicola TaxID=279322 RepID=A0AA48L847_9TREE|nr:uncharacterized protein CcaverHIS019_0601000 [Cutaneotrichosporon cavernicola]BEI93641.1 hypothetical protein CcaverHIS019_0601000 [Cutaneotrichosporon cavernicola]BEJ01418.1 hypothetical protein CcaverHIS631_0601000 [Cutaneotrichosporon cavernicola]BEJ09185.1 hypothetical protein CcaverHIS641_0601000 [Cutaneotrichosporon cavernicola]
MVSIPARSPTLHAKSSNSALNFGGIAASTYSPLDQLRLARSPLTDLVNDPLCRTTPNPSVPTPLPQPQSSVTPSPSAIPPLKLNLFRSSSIYSFDSEYSYSTLSADDATERYGYPLAAEQGLSSETDTPLSPAEAPDDAYMSPDEADVIVFSTPSTPRGRRFLGSDATSPVASGAATPTAMLARSEHRTDPDAQTLPYAPGTLRSAVSEGPFALRSVPVRTPRSTSASTSPRGSQAYPAARAVSEPLDLSTSHRIGAPVAQLAISPRYPETVAAPDWASVHGELGSDWGDDENDFEWLDSSEAPRADTINDHQRAGPRGHGGAATGDCSSSGTEGACAPPLERRRTKKRRPYVIPRRPAPPPPPDGGISVVPVEVTRSRSPGPGKSHTSSAADRSSPSPDGVLDFPKPNNLHDDGSSNMGSTSNLPGAEEQSLPPLVIITATPPRQSPALLSAKDRNAITMNKSASHQSGYSFYDLGDSPSRTPDRNASGTFPRGKYARVPLHELNGTSPTESTKNRQRIDTGSRHSRRPSADDAPSPMSGRRGLRSPDSSATLSRTNLNHVPTLAEASMMRPEELVAAGLQRREAGDKPKSAWFFMKAAELGSVTGQLHWGIALRHGLGIGRDERRAFTELSEACDRGLAEGVFDLRAAVGSLLPPTTARQMPRDLAVGLFELSNCYLDGAGTRRNADLALEYLRMAGSLGDMAAQEQLGLVLSKGMNSVKKDLREAAKWYRAAIQNGSNTPGLAWVWKDKYNDA